MQGKGKARDSHTHTLLFFAYKHVAVMIISEAAWFVLGW
jgi:hypothetical protein